MKRIIYFVLFFVSLTAQSQIFAPIGASWYYSSQNQGAAPTNSEYILYESTKDSTINGHAVRKIERKCYHYRGTVSTLPSLFVYNSPDTAFIYNPKSDKFDKLYIFNKNKGDTLKLDIPFESNSYTQSIKNEYRLVIDSVAVEINNGKTTKKYKTRGLDSFQFCSDGWFMDYAGGLDWFFPRAGGITPEADGPLRCYNDPLLSIHFSSIACDYRLINTSVPQIGTKWYYTSKFMTPDMGYYQLEYVKDSTIIDKTCKVFEVINVNSKSQIVSKSYFYLLYNNRKIMQYMNSKYYLLYDFNVNNGDTLNTTYSFSENRFKDTQIKLKVNEVKDTTINGLKLRCYTFDCINSLSVNNNNNQCVSFSGKAIENMGNITSYFFPTDCTITDILKPTEFRCYQNNNFIFKSKLYENKECDSVYVYPPNAVDESMLNNDQKIIFDAEKNHFTINWAGNSKREFAIYDTLGKMCIKDELQNDMPVSIKYLNSGIYFLVVQLEHESVKLKFIKK
jgi:hypothetical protein